jgi:hypothetical protein
MKDAAALARVSQSEATTIFRKYVFAPQSVGGWARGDWICTSPDVKRYLTQRVHQWLAAQEDEDDA